MKLALLIWIYKEIENMEKIRMNEKIGNRKKAKFEKLKSEKMGL